MTGKQLLVNLLGTPTLTWQNQPIVIPRRQARALLYCLAIEMQPVARDMLLLRLWPDLDDATGRRNLTRLLNTLRHDLPHPDILQATHAAIALNQELVWSDAATFVDLAAANNMPQWETAVTLIRGPFLSGFSLPNSAEFDTWQSQQQHAFERRYLTLLANLVNAHRQRKQLTPAIAYAQRYLVADDLAEEMHRHLIELYAQTGDRSAAVRQFEQCVLVLERELGVSPLPETRAAYEAALEGIPLAAPEVQPEPEWAVLPSLDLPLVGREDALAALHEAYRRRTAGGAIIISGAAGVGKSRLMRAFARRSDALVLTGNSHPEETMLPYQPILQMLRQALPLHSRWQPTPPIWLAELARLLPELRAYSPDLPAAMDVEPEQAQARLFEALWQVFANLAVASPLLLCLDDVHWLDTATQGWLQYLTNRLSGSQICILAAYRSSSPLEVDGWQRALRRADLMADVTLDGLAETAVTTLLRQLPESPPQAEQLATRIHAATGGNAFFVLETIRELLSAGQLAGDAVLPLPPTVRDAVLRRAGRLTPLVRQVLEVTAVLSPTATLEAITETAGRDAMETAVSLEELIDRQMLWSDGEQFHFQHALAKDAIYQEISPWRRRLLHRRAANILASLPESEKELAVIAAHFEGAGDVMAAIDYYRQAAAANMTVYAHQTATHHLQRALALAAETPLATAVLPQLHELLGDSLVITGRFADAETAYRTALTCLPENNPFALADIEGKLAATLPAQRRLAEAESLYRQALSRLDALPVTGVAQWQSTRLNILLGLLDVLYFTLVPEPMARLWAEAEALLEAGGTLEQQVRYYTRLNQMVYLQHQFRTPDDNIPRARRALALAYESGNRWLIIRQHFHLGFHFLWSGELTDARIHLGQALTSAGELGDIWLQIQSLVYLSILCRLTGEVEQVAAYLETFLVLSRHSKNVMYVGVGEAQRAWLHYQAGEWPQAQAVAEAALATWSEAAYPFHWLAAWPLLALALRQNRLPDAIHAARAMRQPRQQKLPDEIEVQLQTAVSAWEADDVAGAQDALRTAVTLAHQHGYL